jgi:phage gp46-like protein
MLKLIQTDNAVFDLVFDDASDDDAAIQTLVYTVLFTDAEAPESRVADRYERRGWWADPEAGTGLWHVRRQALTDTARREAMSMVEQALLDHGVTSVSVSEQPVSGNVSSLFMLISGVHNGRTFNMSVPL